MNHCKDKKKHKWEKKYGMVEECTVCKKVKPFRKEFPKGRKFSKGAFGSYNPVDNMFDMKVPQKEKKNEI